jgi:hypothetical protein
MLSNDQNIEHIGQLAELLGHYLGLQAEYVKLDAVEKVVRLLTAAALAILFFLLIIAVMLFLSFAAAYWLGQHIGMAPAFCVIGGFHLLDSDDKHSFESEDQLAAMAERLAARYPRVSFLTGHCTGSRAFRILQSVLGSRLQQFACGMQIDIVLKRKGSGSEVIPGRINPL